MLKRHPVLTVVAIALVLAGGVAAATFATLVAEAPPPECPDRSLGCFELLPGEPVQIGVLITSSGPQASVGAEAIRAARLAAEEAPPILGRPVTVLARDDRCTVPSALQGARELASDPPAEPPSVAVVGAVCPGTTSPVAQLVSDVGLTLVSWSNDPVSFEDPPRALFLRIPPNPAGERQGFERRFAARYGGRPAGDQAWPAFWGTALAIRTVRDVAVPGAGGVLLVPKDPLFAALRDLTAQGG